MSAALCAFLPSPREEQDALILDVVGPLLREVAAKQGLETSWFERINKPVWGIRITLVGGRPSFEQLRLLLESRAGDARAELAIVPEDEEDKWVGGVADRMWLADIHSRDTRACMALLEAERSDPAVSRARLALLVAEGLLDLLDLDDAGRLEFDRRGFVWEIDLGRWDEDVIAALEDKLERQRDALRVVLAGRSEPPAWGSNSAAAIGGALLVSLAEPVRRIRDAQARGALARPVLDYAVFAVRAHVNRLGLQATQEAAVRYLMWRMRGGARGPRL